MTEEQIAAKVITEHEFWEGLEDIVAHYTVVREAYTEWRNGLITVDEFHGKVYGLEITNTQEDEE